MGAAHLLRGRLYDGVPEHVPAVLCRAGRGQDIALILILPRFFEDKLFAVFFAEPVADFLAAATTTILFLIRFRQIIRGMQEKGKAKV